MCASHVGYYSRSRSYPMSGTGVRYPPAYHWWFAANLYLLAILTGMNGDGSNPILQDILLPYGMLLVLGGWVIADCAERGNPLPVFSHAWVACLCYLSVPYCVIRTRGWRGLGWILFHVAMCTVLALLAMPPTL